MCSRINSRFYYPQILEFVLLEIVSRCVVVWGGGGWLKLIEINVAFVLSVWCECILWYFWCMTISNCRLLRRVCMKRWLEIVRVEWLCIGSIWLYGASVKSIELQQFEINTSRSLSVGISFLSLSKSLSNLRTSCELAKSTRRSFRKGRFLLVTMI